MHLLGVDRVVVHVEGREHRGAGELGVELEDVLVVDHLALVGALAQLGGDRGGAVRQDDGTAGAHQERALAAVDELVEDRAVELEARQVHVLEGDALEGEVVQLVGVDLVDLPGAVEGDELELVLEAAAGVLHVGAGEAVDEADLGALLVAGDDGRRPVVADEVLLRLADEVDGEGGQLLHLVGAGVVVHGLRERVHELLVVGLLDHRRDDAGVALGALAGVDGDDALDGTVAHRGLAVGERDADRVVLVAVRDVAGDLAGLGGLVVRLVPDEDDGRDAGDRGEEAHEGTGHVVFPERTGLKWSAEPVAHNRRCLYPGIRAISPDCISPLGQGGSKWSVPSEPAKSTPYTKSCQGPNGTQQDFFSKFSEKFIVFARYSSLSQHPNRLLRTASTPPRSTAVPRYYLHLH